MGTERGIDTRLSFGDGANSEAFATLGGEKSFDWNQASNDLDTSDKDGPSGYFIPGRINFSVQGNVKLPSAGFSAAYAAAKSGASIHMKAMKGAVVRYSGGVTVGNFKTSYPNDGTVNYSFDLANSEPPSVNDLTANA
jgi:hypothetical protein